MRVVSRGLGAWGDMVIYLRNGDKLELRSLAKCVCHTCGPAAAWSLFLGFCCAAGWLKVLAVTRARPLLLLLLLLMGSGASNSLCLATLSARVFLLVGVFFVASTSAG